MNVLIVLAALFFGVVLALVTLQLFKREYARDGDYGFVLLIAYCLIGLPLAVNYAVSVDGETSYSGFTSFDGWCSASFIHLIRGSFLPISWREEVALQSEACIDLVKGGYREMSYVDFLVKKKEWSVE